MVKPEFSAKGSLVLFVNDVRELLDIAEPVTSDSVKAEFKKMREIVFEPRGLGTHYKNEPWRVVFSSFEITISTSAEICGRYETISNRGGDYVANRPKHPSRRKDCPSR
jgi:hypothetical protein